MTEQTVNIVAAGYRLRALIPPSEDPILEGLRLFVKEYDPDGHILVEANFEKHPVISITVFASNG